MHRHVATGLCGYIPESHSGTSFTSASFRNPGWMARSLGRAFGPTAARTCDESLLAPPPPLWLQPVFFFRGSSAAAAAAGALPFFRGFSLRVFRAHATRRRLQLYQGRGGGGEERERESRAPVVNQGSVARESAIRIYGVPGSLSLSLSLSLALGF